MYYVPVTSGKEEETIGTLYLSMLAKGFFCHIAGRRAEICKGKICTAVAAKIPFPPVDQPSADNAVFHYFSLYFPLLSLPLKLTINNKPCTFNSIKANAKGMYINTQAVLILEIYLSDG